MALRVVVGGAFVVVVVGGASVVVGGAFVVVVVGGTVVGATCVVVDLCAGAVVVECGGGGATVVVVVAGGDVVDEPVGVAGVATNAGSEGVAARYPKSPTSPNTAPLSINVGLFIVDAPGVRDRRGGRTYSERERLVVKAFGARSEAHCRSHDGFSKVTRSTHIDVGVVQGTHEAAHRTFVKAYLVTRPAQLVVATLTAFDEFGEFATVDNVCGRSSANNDGHRRGHGEILEQCAKRRHSDAGADQYHATCRESVAGEGAIRTFDNDASTWLEAGHCAALIAESLDGDA